MTCFRRRRLRIRIAWLALFGLLWTQVTLAGHGLCVLDALGGDAVPVETVAKHGCHDSPAGATMPTVDSLVCTAHCSQGEQSSENARVPLLVALPVERWFPPALTTFGDTVPAQTLRDPRGHHHRPTAHPATLLLI
jgi:hypothetical protein